MSSTNNPSGDWRQLLQGVDFSAELATRDKAHRAEMRRTLAGFLEVLDALDRAAAQPDASATLRALQKQLVTACQQAGIQFFVSRGQPFDPQRHRALETRLERGAGEIVIEEITRGCEWGGELLRPAGVVVARNP